MRTPLIRTLIAGAAVLAVAAVGVPAATADPPEGGDSICGSPSGQTIYLKGSGSSFSMDGWQNVFYADGRTADDYANEGSVPNVWHLVYSGDSFGSVTEMQLTFTNGEVFEWTPERNPSVNAGGNNPGWVIAAPYDWQIAYVNSGNNNQSPSCLVTGESGNLQFNISGYSQGKAPAVGAIDFSVEATTQWQHTTSWELWERTVQPVWQRTIREIFAPQYKKEVSSAKGTLVSGLKYDSDTATAQPVDGGLIGTMGKNGKFSTNGFTYVTVDLDDPRLDDGGFIEVPIADSSYNANGKKTPAEYNRPIGYSYRVSLDGDNLAISFDERIIATSVAAHVSDDGVMPTAVPGAHTANGAVVSVAGKSGLVRLFVHLEGISWFTTGKYILAGYVLVDTEVSDVWVRDDLVSDLFVRKDSKTETKTAPLQDLSGFTVEVTDADGKVVMNRSGDALGRLDGLRAGAYSVTLSGNGIEPVTVKVDVAAGKTATVSFTDIVVIGADTDSTADKVYLDDVVLDKTYLTDVVLKPTYLTEEEAGQQYPDHQLKLN